MPFQIIRNDITKVEADAIVDTADARAFVITDSLLDDLKRFVDDNYVSERNEEEYRIDVRPCPSASVEASGREARPIRRRILRRREAEDALDSSAPLSLPSDAPMACAPSLEDMLRQREKTFSEYLLDLLRERDGKDSEVYKRAEVSKQLFSKILNNRDYQPTKSTVIQLAVGLQLDLNETQRLLGKAGFALTRSSKADLVVEYCIRHGLYSVPFINEALYDCGLPLLKTGLKT